MGHAQGGMAVAGVALHSLIPRHFFEQLELRGVVLRWGRVFCEVPAVKQGSEK